MGNTNDSDSGRGVASINRMRLDAQRRSAHHYLTEYLAIRRKILSRRSPTTQAASEESDMEWIRRLIRDTTSSRRSRARSVPGKLPSLTHGFRQWLEIHVLIIFAHSREHQKSWQATSGSS
jgi:hypothetical protein